jgi:hypothetical protein
MVFFFFFHEFVSKGGQGGGERALLRKWSLWVVGLAGRGFLS